MSNVPMTSPEEMLAEHRTDYNRGSTFVRRQDGSILQLQSPKFLTSNDDGITWSEPFEKRDAAGDLVGGSSLVNLSGNGIGLAGNMRDEDVGSPEEVDRSGHMVFRRSEDGGETWEAPVRATPESVPHRRLPRHDDPHVFGPPNHARIRRFRPADQARRADARQVRKAAQGAVGGHALSMASENVTCIARDDNRWLLFDPISLHARAQSFHVLLCRVPMDAEFPGDPSSRQPVMCSASKLLST